jgi:pSer/pThr/pTyr-binding forkhead associated (FHA) protein
VHVRSDGQQQAVPLKQGRMLIGRQEDCQIRIPAASVSRHHCEVVTSGSGVRIKDLGSSNGTFVNGQRVEEADLTAGDVLEIGTMLFVVRIDGDPGAIDPEAIGQRVRSAATNAAAGSGDAPSSDDSSVDFDFDFSDDDEDDQPAL